MYIRLEYETGGGIIRCIYIHQCVCIRDGRAHYFLSYLLRVPPLAFIVCINKHFASHLFAIREMTLPKRMWRAKTTEEGHREGKMREPAEELLLLLDARWRGTNITFCLFLRNRETGRGPDFAAASNNFLFSCPAELKAVSKTDTLSLTHSEGEIRTHRKNKIPGKTLNSLPLAFFRAPYTGKKSLSALSHALTQRDESRETSFFFSTILGLSLAHRVSEPTTEIESVRERGGKSMLVLPLPHSHTLIQQPFGEIPSSFHAGLSPLPRSSFSPSRKKAFL